MRTDVKIGLVCAFVIVMGAVIYFVAQPARPTPSHAGTTGAGSAALTSPPATAPSTAPAAFGSALSSTGAVTGPSILPPGSGSPLTAGTPGSPGLTGSGVPSMTDSSVGVAGTTGSTGSTLGTTGLGSFGSSTANGGFGSSLSGSTGTGMTGSSGFTTGNGNASAAGPRATIDYGTPRSDSTPSFGSGSLSSRTGGNAMDNSSATASTTYTIQKGDMLGAIATKFGVTVAAIKTANPGIDPNRLKVDKAINIPAGSMTAATGTPAASGAASAAHAGTTGTAHTGTTSTAAATTVVAAAKPGASYKIKKGDTLVTIARTAYGSDKSWKRILQANSSEISNPNLVPVGLVIKIPQ